jgi:hypothetical protein
MEHLELIKLPAIMQLTRGRPEGTIGLLLDRLPHPPDLTSEHIHRRVMGISAPHTLSCKEARP